MSDEYETMGPGELLARLDDWMDVAADRGARIVELEAERDRLRAVVDDTLVWLRQMTDLACPVDVLHVADLYRTVTGRLDAEGT